VLFNGEAIFGVIHFGGASHLASAYAHRIADQAKRLGACAEFRSTGAASLGWATMQGSARRAAREPGSGAVPGVVCGEFVDRHDSSFLYDEEPGRSAFLAAGIRDEGPIFFDRVDGTFAAAIWCERDGRLILACDRRADCRLYYTVKDGQIVFSSWLPLLRCASPEIDGLAVAEFLRFLYIAPPRTLYKGVASVEPGHYVIASAVTVETKPMVKRNRFHSPGDKPNQDGDTFSEFKCLMEQAVARRLGRRRAAVFLSSGVDSATIMGASHKLGPGQIEAYTIGFDQPDLDETNGAQILARQLGVPYRELRFDLEQYEAAFQQMINSFEQPFGDPAALPLILATQQLSESVEVITGGTGGDDLFGAPVPRHLWFSTTIADRLPRCLRQPLAKAAAVAGRGDVFAFDDLEELFVTWKGWTKRDLRELLGTTPDFTDSGFYRKFREHRHCDPQTLYDAVGIYPPDDCRFESAALALLPIELPYHDCDLNAYVHGLPADLRMSNGQTKVLLRRLFDEYFPAAGLPSKKHYFNIPLQRMMARANFAMVKEWLAPERIRKHGLVDARSVQPWIDRFVSGDEEVRFKIWALIVLHAWLDEGQP